MQIFVWVSDEINVYRANDINEIHNVLTKISHVMAKNGWYEQVLQHLTELSDALSEIERNPTDLVYDHNKKMVQYRITINSLLVLSINHPLFQYGTGFKTLIDV